jgi:hypothetical protein
MKKYILAIAILFISSVSMAQYQTRYNYANKDSLRTQIRMAAIEVSVERFDTATNGSKRLAMDILRVPTASNWLDIFVYPIVILLNTGTPTDAVVKGLVNNLWARVAQINTSR